MSATSDTRAARRARRSLCTARVWLDVDEDVAACLASDDDTFFGSDVDVESDMASTPSSPAAKRPCLSDTWAGQSSGSESEASQASLEEEDERAESDTDAGDSLQDVQTRVQTGCKCTSKNHFVALAATELLTIQTQMAKMKKTDKDCFLLGMLSGGIFSDAKSHGGTTTHAPRERVKFDCRLFGHGVCREAFLYAFKLSATHLKRLQKLCWSICLFTQSTWWYWRTTLEFVQC